MPRLFDDNAPAPVERRVVPPVNRVPGPHYYRLAFGNEFETIVAESATEAVAAREHAWLPDTITDLTEMDAWITRRLATRGEG